MTTSSPRTLPSCAEVPTCYTWGYAGRDPEERATAVAHLNAIVVDVRLKPFSRQLGWSRAALMPLLTDRYVHAPRSGTSTTRAGRSGCRASPLDCGR